MPELNRKIAVAIPVLVAVLVYSNSFFNRWALDDYALIANNPTAQSIGGGVGGFFQPYWPPDASGNSAGLYRPLTMLTYGVDWALSGGRPELFHVSNVAMHAVATALVVLLALAWLTPMGALVTGVLFAVHPVHVEAVANVVGRAEILSAIGLLLAVLAARRYRAQPKGTRASHWLLLVAAAVLFAQLSKENGVVAIAILGLDHLLDSRPAVRSTFNMYALVAAITIGWFYLWASIAGSAVDFTVAPALRWLTYPQRLATALPVQLDVVRLLVWPMNLAASYDPQLIPQRTQFGVMAALGFVTAFSIILLGLASLKKAPVVAFALLAAMVSYAPASNLIFGAGLTLGERTLYFSSIGPVLVVGWLVANGGYKRGRQMLLGALILALVFSARTVTRNPFWVDMRSVITNDMLEHPEGFRTQIRIGEAFEAVGDSSAALRYFLTAVELFDADPFASEPLVDLALGMNRDRLAESEAKRAYLIAPFHADIVALYSRTLATVGKIDSALTVARSGYERSPSAGTAWLYLEIIENTGAPDWQLGLARARYSWLSGRVIEATHQLGNLGDVRIHLVGKNDFCWELDQSRGIVAALDAELAANLETLRERATCSPVIR